MTEHCHKRGMVEHCSNQKMAKHYSNKEWLSIISIEILLSTIAKMAQFTEAKWLTKL
jgi:hypothetical protein